MILVSTMASPCTMLHTLILCPRTGHKVLGAWIKDSLVKQGQTTAKAENLVKNVSTTINTLSYDVRAFSNFVSTLAASRRPFADSEKEGSGIDIADDMPNFVDLLLYDTIMAKAHISLDRIANGHRRKAAKDDDKASSSAADLAPESVAALKDLGQLAARLVRTMMTIAKSHVIRDTLG